MNPVPATSNLSIVESPDIVSGSFIDAEIDYNDGTLILYGTEYFDNTPSSNFDTSKIFMLDGNVGIDGLMEDLSLVGATSATKNDLALTVYLTEVQRVRCIQASGTPGGWRKRQSHYHFRGY